MTSIGIIANTDYIRMAENKEQQPELQSIEKKGLPPATPSQPQPGSSISENELWRMLAEAAKVVANGMSGTAKENSDAKKMLISTLKDAQIAQLNERMEQLEKQAAAEKKKSFWSKFGMALGIVATLIVAPFNPVMAAVMIATMIATMVIPKVVCKILEACGVDEKIRKWVDISLQVIIGVVGAVLSFNPGNIMAAASKAAVSSATKVASVVERTISALKSFKAFSTISQKTNSLINKALKLLEPLISKIKEFSKGGQLATARIGQASSVSSNLTSVVSSGYAINSSAITKNLEIAKANQDELEARFQQLQIMLNTAMQAVTKSFEALFSIKNDERQFNKKMLSIHL